MYYRKPVCVCVCVCVCFGELLKPHPRHGPKRHWRDLVVMDIQTLGIGDWYEIAQDRQQWTIICERICASVGVGEVCAVNTPLIRSFTCTCGRSFKRSGDLTRHRHFCGTQHLDHVNLEPSTFYCSCGRSFQRKGDLTRHSHFCKAT